MIRRHKTAAKNDLKPMLILNDVSLFVTIQLAVQSAAAFSTASTVKVKSIIYFFLKSTNRTNSSLKPEFRAAVDSRRVHRLRQILAKFEGLVSHVQDRINCMYINNNNNNNNIYHSIVPPDCCVTMLSPVQRIV